jgi:hypothetical protein
VGGGGLTMSNIEFPEWQEPYLEALMETDQRKLVGRVKFAEKTILLRLEEIQSSSQRRAEEQAIEDALRALTFLRRESIELETRKENSSLQASYRLTNRCVTLLARPRLSWLV